MKRRVGGVSASEVRGIVASKKKKIMARVCIELEKVVMGNGSKRVWMFIYFVVWARWRAVS
jgi:hypothetical protein